MAQVIYRPEALPAICPGTEENSKHEPKMVAWPYSFFTYHRNLEGWECSFMPAI